MFAGILDSVEGGISMKRVILFAFLVLIISSTANARLINVPADYDSIQLGVEAAINGDTVLVDEGHYYDQINFLGKSILLTSNYIYNPDSSIVANTIIDGSNITNPDTQSVVLFISGEDTTSILQGFTITGGDGTTPDVDNTYGGGIYMHSSSATIVNNHIKNNRAVNNDFLWGIGGGIYASGSPHLRIIGNTISENISDGWYGSRGGGLYITGERAIAKNNKVTGNHASASSPVAHGGSNGGMYCEGAYLTISENQILENSTGGFEPWGPAGVTIMGSNNTIDNNTIENNFISNGYSGYVQSIALHIDGEDNNIEENIIQNNYADLYHQSSSLPSIHLNGNNNIFKGNLILESDEDMISIYITGSSNIIDKNIIADCYNYSIKFFAGVQEIIISNNTIFGSGKSGIAIFGQENPINNIIILNNIFMNNSEYAIYDTAGIDPLILYNSFYENDSGNFYNCEPSLGNIYDNPLLVDPENGDFNLQEYSPCIDAGFPGSPLDPDSTRADIGALYFRQMTSIDDGTTNLPDYFYLTNYPNPFNQSTKIKYSIPHQTDVRLEIYNLLGQRVETLVENIQKPGNYSINWDASGFSSGIYFYRLTTGDKSYSKRMTLLK